jgi:hypothetical protein
MVYWKIDKHGENSKEICKVCVAIDFHSIFFVVSEN